MYGRPILGCQFALRAMRVRSARGMVGVVEEERVERDVEEQKDGTNETDTEKEDL